MRIMTYNIHEWKGVDGRVDPERIAGVIHECQADVVALQEVVDPLEGRHPLAEVALALDMVVAHHGRHAILSRFPIISQQPHMTRKHGGGTGVRLLEGRFALAEEQVLTVYAVHLWWSSEVTRLGQIEDGLERITRAAQHPHILLGDFNALAPGDSSLPHLYIDDPDPDVKPPFPTTDERLASELPELYVQVPGEADSAGSNVPGPKHNIVRCVERAGYVDAFRAAGCGKPGTWLVPEPQIRVDYIFVPLTLRTRLIRCWRFDEGLARVASDHFPVLADLHVEGVAEGES